MPNWCDNQMTVTGPDAEVERFKTSVRSDESHLSLDKLRPLRASPGTNPTVQDLRQQRWGTTYEILDACADDVAGGVLYSYQTGWTPISDECLVAVSRRYPGLRFDMQYEEPGCDFKGGCIVENGKVVETWCRELTHEERWPDGNDDEE